MTPHPPGPRRFRIGDDVDPAEARLVEDVLHKAGWASTSGDDWDLAWLARPDREIPPGRLASRIPGASLLERRDVVSAGVRRARERRGAVDDADLAGLLATYVLPDDEEALRAAMRATPEGRWRQRPAATTAGAPESPVDLDRHAESSAQWVVQPELAAHRVDGKPIAMRCLALLACLDPLLLYVLDGGLCPGGDGSGELAFLYLSPSAPGTDRRVLADRLVSLAGEVAIALREDLVRASTDGAPSGARCFQLLGVTALLDESLRPWLLEADTEPLSRWRPPDGVAAVLVESAVAALDAIGPDPVHAPRRIGPLVRAVPGPRPEETLAALALPRPADIALAAAEPGGAPSREPELVPSPGLRQWFLGSDLVLYVAARGDLQVVNATGAFVWAALREGLGPDAIAAELAEAFGEPAERTRAQVRNLLGEWVDGGVLVRAGAATVAPPTAPREPSVRYVRWNLDRVYRCLDRSVSVRPPNREIAAFVDTALAGLADPDPTEVAAFVEIVPDGGGWTVAGTCFGARRCPSVHQLPSLVRAAVLASAARTSEAPAFRATALERAGSIVVVVGTEAGRAELVVAWLAAGGTVLADSIVTVDDDLRVQPVRAGFALLQGYQWIDGTPQPFGSAGAPLVDEEGRLARYWLPEPEAASTQALPARAVVVPGAPAGQGAASVSAAEALARLLEQRVAGRVAVSVHEAAELVRWLASVPCWAASLDDPRALAAELRTLCDAAAGGTGR